MSPNQNDPVRTLPHVPAARRVQIDGAPYPPAMDVPRNSPEWFRLLASCVGNDSDNHRWLQIVGQSSGARERRGYPFVITLNCPGFMI